MYNNIKKFVSPKYATLFLFCITALLVVIFMKSRIEPFSTSEQRVIDKINVNIANKLDKATDKVNTAIQNTSAINNLRDNKSDKDDLKSYAKTDDVTKSLNSKLNTSDFGTTLVADSTIKSLQADKLDKSDFTNGLKRYAKTADVNTSLNSKLNTSDFGTTLAADPTIKGLQSDKLDKSVYDNDMKSVPTLNNLDTTIGGVVDTKVAEKVGVIQSAKADYTTAYGDFNNNYDTKIINFNNNYDTKTTTFNDNATSKTNAFDTNASGKTTTFNSNADTRYDQVNALKLAADQAKTDAVAAKDAAVQAQVDSQKIYDDVFKEQSGRVITQSNFYRSGFKFNPSSGFYENAESFTTIEGLAVSNDIFELEKEVIQNINTFNSKYYDYLSCKADSTKCPTGKTATDLKNELLVDSAGKKALSNVLKESIAALKTEYAKLQQTDNTQALLDKAALVDDLRQDLDAKMTRIMESKTAPNEMTRQLDSTVYAGILWSVLGTSLLYYIFTE